MSEIGVGLIGYKFMGRAHSNGYRQVSHFFDVDPIPRMVAIAGRNEAPSTSESIVAGLHPTPVPSSRCFSISPETPTFL